MNVLNLIVIKNDKGSNDARIPGIDPSIQMDGLFIDRAIKIPITTRIISPTAYFKYFPVLFFSIRS